MDRNSGYFWYFLLHASCHRKPGQSPTPAAEFGQDAFSEWVSGVANARIWRGWARAPGSVRERTVVSKSDGK